MYFIKTLLLFFFLFSCKNSHVDSKTKTIDIAQTRVDTQLTTPNCWSYSMTAYLESILFNERGMNINLSEEYLYFYHFYEQLLSINGAGNIYSLSNISEIQSGTDTLSALKLIDQYGLISETYLKIKPPKYSEAEDLAASIRKDFANELSTMTNEQIKTKLLERFANHFDYKGSENDPYLVELFLKNRFKKESGEIINLGEYKQYISFPGSGAFESFVLYDNRYYPENMRRVLGALLQQNPGILSYKVTKDARHSALITDFVMEGGKEGSLEKDEILKSIHNSLKYLIIKNSWGRLAYPVKMSMGKDFLKDNETKPGYFNLYQAFFQSPPKFGSNAPSNVVKVFLPRDKTTPLSPGLVNQVFPDYDVSVSMFLKENDDKKGVTLTYNLVTNENDSKRFDVFFYGVKKEYYSETAIYFTTLTSPYGLSVKTSPISDDVTLKEITPNGSFQFDTLSDAQYKGCMKITHHNHWGKKIRIKNTQKNETYQEVVCTDYVTIGTPAKSPHVFNVELKLKLNYNKDSGKINLNSYFDMSVLGEDISDVNCSNCQVDAYLYIKEEEKPSGFMRRYSYIRKEIEETIAEKIDWENIDMRASVVHIPFIENFKPQTIKKANTAFNLNTNQLKAGTKYKLCATITESGRFEKVIDIVTGGNAAASAGEREVCSQPVEYKM